jgi:predicted O-methyltransferase YrrM
MDAVRSWSSGDLPRVFMRDLFPGIERCGPIVVQKPEGREIGFSLDLQELVHVLSAVKFSGAKYILEIGTFDGFTAINLAANIDREGKVVTVDLPNGAGRDNPDNPYAPYPVGSKFRDEPDSAKIEQLWADSTKTDWRSFGAPFDIILIDGSHVYRDVKSDSANALRHLRPGGAVFWHDYGHFVDVSKALDELARDHSIAVIKGTRLACFREKTSNAKM